MWPFSKKPKEPKPPSWKQQAVKQMKDWRPIGQTFQYLGRECVVTGYCSYFFHDLGTSIDVELKADYADDHGVIHNLVFDWQEAQALMANNP